MKIVDILTDRGFTYNGIAVEGWQSYQEALDEQAPEYGYTKQPQKVVGVWYRGERIYDNERRITNDE